MKQVEFHGTSLADLKAFPDAAMKMAGQQLRKVQYCQDPISWKPLKRIGAGVREIRVRERNEQYRVIYVAKFEDAVHVLHAFFKNTKTTRKSDIDLAKKRYKEISRGK